jgi:hypothetical protein
LSPAVAKKAANPERKKREPDGGGDHQVVESELARVNIIHLIRGVVHVSGVGFSTGIGAARLVINTNAYTKLDITNRT